MDSCTFGILVLHAGHRFLSAIAACRSMRWPQWPSLLYSFLIDYLMNSVHQHVNGSQRASSIEQKGIMRHAHLEC